MTQANNNINQPTPPDTISVGEVVANMRQVRQHVTQKWPVLLAALAIGAVLGLAYSLFVKPKYTAVCSFVLDENDQSGMLGQYAGLAALAGVDLSGSGSAIFKGDNILDLYRSRVMLEKTLLTSVDINGRNEKLIDRYVDFNHLQKKWQGSDETGSINFNGDPQKFNRKQDSLITDIIKTFNKSYLDVSKPDKKLATIKVSFTSRDEVFAKTFTEQLVKNVNDFYVQTRTKKTAQNVQVLQRQADSVKRSLNGSIAGVASAMDAAPNANPELLSLRVPSQKKQVDVQAGTAIYSEIIKNLEIAKISLRQQTPLIQLIDEPIYPLDSNRVKPLKGAIIGAVLVLIVTTVWLAVRAWWQLFTR